MIFNFNLTRSGVASLVVSLTPAGIWAADASLVNAAAQFIPMGGTVTLLTAGAGIMQCAGRPLSKLNVAFQGNVLNVAGQTATIKIQRSTDHGATFADVAGATSGALATTAGANSASIAFASVLIAEGDVLQAVITPSAILTAVLTNIEVALK